MWILNFIPDSYLEMIVNGILIAGAIFTFLSYFVVNRILRWIPGLSPYLTAVQILSAVLLMAGVYFKGSYQTEAEWRKKVAEAQAKVEKAEQLAKDANEALKKKTAEKNKVVRGKEIIVKQYIEREVTKYDNTCPVPGAVIKAHNAAAKQEPIK